MSTPRSHALSELADQSGFDRRTIVYYIQTGLLPKVGRRGPHTRYPEECLSRLLFIKGVRELQASGQLLSASLTEIGRALAALDAQGIRQILDRGLPTAEIEQLFAEPARPTAPPTINPQPAGDRRSYGLADAAIRQRLGTEHVPVAVAAAAPATVSAEISSRPAGSSQDDHADLGHLLRELELRPTLNPKRNPPGAPEQWTEIPITSRVYLSVRGLPEEDAAIAEAMARLLKRALRGRPSSATPANNETPPPGHQP